MNYWRRLPQHNDETVEHVESVSDVAEKSFGEHLHQHLHSEQTAEEQVAVFQYECVNLRLQHIAVWQLRFIHLFHNK